MQQTILLTYLLRTGNISANTIDWLVDLEKGVINPIKDVNQGRALVTRVFEEDFWV